MLFLRGLNANFFTMGPKVGRHVPHQFDPAKVYIEYLETQS